MVLFHLNLYIHDVTISHRLVDKTKNIWCVLSVDGCQNPIATSSFPMSAKCDFCQPLEIPFQAPNLRNVYLYMTVCSFGASQSEMIPVCRAKTRVANLPLNSPNAFRMPLYSVQRPRKPLFYATISGIIDPIEEAEEPKSTPLPIVAEQIVLSGMRRKITARANGSGAEYVPLQ